VEKKTLLEFSLPIRGGKQNNVTGEPLLVFPHQKRKRTTGAKKLT
jgi:hypothetical protein